MILVNQGYQLIFDQCPIGLGLYDKEKKQFLKVNNCAVELLKSPRKELENRLAEEINKTEEKQYGFTLTNKGKVLSIKVKESEPQANLKLVTVIDISEQVRHAKNLEKQSFTDELTGLYNRRGFLSIGQHRLDLAKRENICLLIIFADLDGLKKINDQLGHKAGDDAIKNCARILKRTLRKSDIIARLGGDEFIILSTISEQEDVNEPTGRLQNAFTEFNQSSEKKYKLSASFGLSKVPPNSKNSLNSLTKRADKAMYLDKQQRRLNTKETS